MVVEWVVGAWWGTLEVAVAQHRLEDFWREQPQRHQRSQSVGGSLIKSALGDLAYQLFATQLLQVVGSLARLVFLGRRRKRS